VEAAGAQRASILRKLPIRPQGATASPNSISFIVMAGLVPAIHVLLVAALAKEDVMPATSAGMTD
jgi:hypothetical protein